MTTKKIFIAIIITIAFLFNAPKANASNLLKYNKLSNAEIGITPFNATGSIYEIKNAEGKVVLRGKITRNKIFYIATKALAVGTYTFTIGGTVLQEFEINN